MKKVNVGLLVSQMLIVLVVHYVVLMVVSMFVSLITMKLRQIITILLPQKQPPQLTLNLLLFLLLNIMNLTLRNHPYLIILQLLHHLLLFLPNLQNLILNLKTLVLLLAAILNAPMKIVKNNVGLKEIVLDMIFAALMDVPMFVFQCIQLQVRQYTYSS